MDVTLDFCGANATILDVSENTVRFEPDLRDTEGEWFYSAFAVRGAAGKTVTFDMPKWFIGYFGAAYSHDLTKWEWTYTASPNHTGFTYSFGPDENLVYFAHHMLYHPSRFYRFAELHGIPVRTLGPDNKGTPIPYVCIGSGPNNIILTARHHCCESTGNYIMEGMLDEFIKSPIPGCRVTAIPFIDADGVVRGDQGKNRRPHDHNRDYTENPLYNGVKAVMSLMAAGDVRYVFDLHSPWHFTGRNDKLFFVRNDVFEREKFIKIGMLLEEEITPDAMAYSSYNDIDAGVEWNNVKNNIQCSSYCGRFPSIELSFSLETPYFGEDGNVVSQDKLVETGRCLMRAIAKYDYQLSK